MDNQICCFAGLKRIPKQDSAEIKRHLESEIRKLIEQGVITFCTGGEPGFDAMAACAVLKLKAEFPRIALVLVLPSLEQPESYRGLNKKIYNQILGQMDMVVYTSEPYYRDCARKRDRYLVDISGVCICYLRDARCAAGYAVDYAREKGLRIINPTAAI